MRIGCALVALLVSGAVLADPWRAASGNSYGWELMTPAERMFGLATTFGLRLAYRR